MCEEMGNMNETTDRTLTTTALSLQIIEVLRELDGAGVTEIADTLDLAPSTVHGHLATLKQAEFITKEAGQYCLGMKFLQLGEYVKHRTEPFSLADKYTERVAEKTGCRSIFGIEEHGRGVYLSHNAGEHSHWEHESAGNRFNLHSTAAGKIMLAYLPEERVQEIIDHRGLPAETEHTITDEEALWEHLADIRERGYAFNLEEEIIGIRAVSVPILTEREQVVGALSANGPANQMSGDRFNEELPETLLGIANEFELDLTLS